MDEHSAVVQRLREHDIGYAELPMGQAHVALIPQRGCHLLGPFDKTTGESVYWLNPAFTERDDFAALLTRNDWNVGGMRLWIAPEIRYGVRDRSRYWESLVVQPDMEPAKAAMTPAENDGLTISYPLALSSHNPEAGVKKLAVQRLLRRSVDPLRHVADTAGLHYFGCTHDVRLEQDEQDGVPAETWNLVQVRGGGKAIVPITGEFSYRDYYEPLEPSHLQTTARAAVLKLDGRKRFKIGVRSFCHYGRIGHYRDHGDGEAELTVCSYFNDPDSWYAEQPADAPECRGLSMHFYNDGGMFGGFGELEANGRTIGTEGEGNYVEDRFSLWWYRGRRERIATVARLLLGIAGIDQEDGDDN